MRFFNDIFDLGIRDELALNIINFFVFFHLILFILLLGYVIKMAVRGEKVAFGDEVTKMRKQVADKDSKKTS